MYITDVQAMHWKRDRMKELAESHSPRYDCVLHHCLCNPFGNSAQPRQPCAYWHKLTLAIPYALPVKSIGPVCNGVLPNIPLLNSQHRAADVMQNWRAGTHLIGYSTVLPAWLQLLYAIRHCGVSLVACCWSLGQRSFTRHQSYQSHQSWPSS